MRDEIIAVNSIEKANKFYFFVVPRAAAAAAVAAERRQKVFFFCVSFGPSSVQSCLNVSMCHRGSKLTFAKNVKFVFFWSSC